MNAKKILIPILLIASLAFVACNSDEMEEDVENAMEDLHEDVSYADTVLMDFMSGDKNDANIICHFSSAVADSELEATTYISNEKIRLEYVMTPPIQGQGDLTIVSDGEYMYMWGNSFLGGVMSGFKVAIGEDMDDMDTDDMASGFLDYSMPMTDCEVWEADGSYFEIPSDVEFMDMYSLVDCSLCDMLPAAEKPSCLEDLGCEVEE